MRKNDTCEICSFKNPKATATAVIVKNKKVLLLKRSEAPLKGMWDLPGGYMNEKEMPVETMRRELKEEFGVYPTRLKFFNFFPGYSHWKGKKFPIISLVFIVTMPLSRKFKLNEESVAYKWFSKKELPQKIAFDSNNEIITYVKKRGLI